MTCPFCDLTDEQVLAETESCVAIATIDAVLVGSVMVIPRVHRDTPFDLSADEWAETGVLLRQLKAQIDEEYRPDGYTIGWNSGEVGGQEVAHAHLHVIPRFADEPLAGRGIRWALKQPSNRRPSIG